MKLKLPEFKMPEMLIQYEKKLSKQWQAMENYLLRHFAFVSIWRKKADKRFKKIGNKIVAISPPWLRRVGRIVWIPFGYVIMRIKKYTERRPHHSFRLTRRRDYRRSLKLPGYWSFTNNVRAMLWKNWRLFGGLMLTYLVIVFVLNSFGQQQAYENLRTALYGAGGELFEGNWGKIAGSGVLLLTSVTTGLQPDVTDAQKVLTVMAIFFAWLATVWALRSVMAGHKVKIRDAVYSSGSPVISTLLVSLILVVQILPLSLAILIYNAAIVSEFISGVEGMLAFVVVILLGVLSLYWITSTIIALVVVTLPGMYPWRAIQTAGDLIIGRRLRVVLRLLWLALVLVVVWAIILIPIILFDDWLKGVWSAVAWVPIVPVSILTMSSITVVFTASYIYMLYRKVVDDDAKPA